MNQTHLTQAQLQTALQQYPVAPLLDFSLAGGGIENSNYLITCNDASRYVLTLLEQPSYCEHEHYVALLDACCAHGLPVPAVVRTTTGTTAIEVEGKPTMLGHFLHGAHVSAPTAAQLTSLGKFVARMHLATQPLAGKVAGYPRDIAWLETSVAQLTPRLPFQQRELLTQAIDACKSLFARQDLAGLSWGVIHGDLFRDNLLFNQQGLTGALDFHHASGGYHLFDLAVAANDWCVGASNAGNAEQSLLDPAQIRALLQGYHGIRSLDEQSLWWFPVFAMYAATVFCLSRLTTKHLQPSARSKDPEQFLRILRGHLAHPVVVDWRMLG